MARGVYLAGGRVRLDPHFRPGILGPQRASARRGVARRAARGRQRVNFMISDARSDVLIHEIAELFARRGREMYAGEPVTQTEHALQAAFQAEQSGADPALITAALLHDVGHLLHGLDEDCAEDGIDDKHEALGAEWLSRH